MVLAAAMVHLALRLLTGTAARLQRQVTGAVHTAKIATTLVQVTQDALARQESYAPPTRYIAFVQLTPVVLLHIAVKVLWVTVTPMVLAMLAPASVLATAAVPLRIPVIGRHCKPRRSVPASLSVFEFTPSLWRLPSSRSGFYEVLVFIGFENKVSCKQKFFTKKESR